MKVYVKDKYGLRLYAMDKKGNILNFKSKEDAQKKLKLKKDQEVYYE